MIQGATILENCSSTFIQMFNSIRKTTTTYKITLKRIFGTIHFNINNAINTTLWNPSILALQKFCIYK